MYILPEKYFQCFIPYQKNIFGVLMFVCLAPLNNGSTPCLIADEEGFISLVDSGRYTCSTITTAKWRCHRNAIFDIAWAQGNTFATASGDTTAVLWDANVPEKQLNIFRGHSCSLKSICVSKFHSSKFDTYRLSLIIILCFNAVESYHLKLNCLRYAILPLGNLTNILLEFTFCWRFYIALYYSLPHRRREGLGGSVPPLFKVQI